MKIDKELSFLIQKLVPGHTDNKFMKFLFICGCSMSGVGKGTTISSIGKLLVEHGNIVTAIKIDPYLNIDAGTMAPAEHGEVYVLDDGGEVDLDLGNYERALNSKFTKDHNITSGKIFLGILNDEREGLFLGKTIQMVPHVTNRIKDSIKDTAYKYRNSEGKQANICLVEIGGTVGDLESSVFFEAIRQLNNELPQKSCAIIVLTYVPMIGSNKEPKTKPTQHGIKDLKSLGLFPNFIICRSDYPMPEDSISKISNYANISNYNVANIYNVNNLYEIPLILTKQGIDKQILNYFELPINTSPFDNLQSIYQAYNKVQQSEKSIKIVAVGKYCTNLDAYYSVVKAVENAALMCNVKVDLIFIEATKIDTHENLDDSLLKDTDSKGNVVREETKKMYKDIITADGIIIPGGFGPRGIESLIKVCRIIRERKIPFLGICLGMQLAVIEFCRNVLNIKDANSKEFIDEKDLETFKSGVITQMIDTNYKTLGGTLRVGLKTAYITKGTLTHRIYGETQVEERHRHRYEVNNDFVPQLEKAGIIFSGRNKEGDRMDMMELSQDVHPFFFATQSHPEFKTNPFYPSLPFYAFILHASKQEKQFEEYSKSKALVHNPKNDSSILEEFDRKYFKNLLKTIENGKKSNQITNFSIQLGNKEI